MTNQEPLRHIPVYPNLRQLKQQAKDLLRAIRAGDEAAIEEINQSHPSASTIPLAKIKLNDVQLALARSYGLSSWPRVVQAC